MNMKVSEACSIISTRQPVCQCIASKREHGKTTAKRVEKGVQNI